MSKIELQAAQTQLPSLIERVSAGEEIVIVQQDRPLAQLIPLRAHRQRRFGSARGQIRMSDNFDEPLRLASLGLADCGAAGR